MTLGSRLTALPAVMMTPVAALMLATLVVLAPGLALACEDLTNRTQTAYKAGDLATLKDTFAAAEANADCSAETLQWMGKAIVSTVLRSVHEDVSQGGSLQAHETALREARPYGQDWRLEAWLGDIAFERGDFTEAATAFQDALNTLNDEELTPTAPDTAVIEEVYNKAEMARLAAADYVSAPTTRSGEPGGLAAPSYRGFQPAARLVPVEFQFGSTLVTSKGLRALRDLRDALRASGTQSITLVGHTDPVGGMAANDRLSLARAESVAASLRNEGYTGQIYVVGRGERDPLRWVAPLTQYQYHQALRRVEVRQ
jgi:outer membrane protein OmpA-like peptidoglycan-associated protein